MQSEYVYPELGDRSTPKEWEANGRPDLLLRAIEEKRRILAEVFPRHVPGDVDAAVRAAFNIMLPKEKMGG